MEQVLAPRFEFKPKNPASGPVEGFDYGEGGYDPNKCNVGFDEVVALSARIDHRIRWSIGGVECPLPVIGGNSSDSRHGSPCCCSRCTTSSATR